jgi:hypothetical protein
MRELRCSWRRKFKSRSSGSWRRAVMRYDLDVSEDVAASIFLWNDGHLRQHYTASQPRRPRREDSRLPSNPRLESVINLTINTADYNSRKATMAPQQSMFIHVYPCAAFWDWGFFCLFRRDYEQVSHPVLTADIDDRFRGKPSNRKMYGSWKTECLVLKTNPMEESPSWEADSHSTSQGIPHLL